MMIAGIISAGSALHNAHVNARSVGGGSLG